MKTTRLLGLGAAMLLGAAQAADVKDELRTCKALADTARRLACFDELADRQLAPPPGTWGAPLPKSAAPTAAGSATAADRFGQPAREVVPDEIRSRIPGRFEGWDAGTDIPLANGQVWRISDGSSAYLNLQDPEVSIRRGVLGGYLLQVVGSNKQARVRRVK